MNHPLRIAFAMGRTAFDEVSPGMRHLLDADHGATRRVEVIDPEPLTELHSPRAHRTMSQAELLITGWEVPWIGPEALDRAAHLRAIVHSAGTLRTFLDPVAFARGIRVSTCATANAVPVAEFALAAIIFGLKRAGRFRHQLLTTRRRRDERGMPRIGMNGVRIGIVGASRVGRELIRLLRAFDVEVAVSDPYLSDADAAALGVEVLPLTQLCASVDVLSVHAPLTDSTRGMIGAPELAALADGAVVVNTARGALIDTDALTAELVTGRLDAHLDVTDPEPPHRDSPLYELPNVTLTPHIAGALGNEVRRLGALAASEAESFAVNGTFSHEVHPSDLATIA